MYVTNILHINVFFINNNLATSVFDLQQCSCGIIRQYIRPIHSFLQQKLQSENKEGCQFCSPATILNT